MKNATVISVVVLIISLCCAAALALMADHEIGRPVNAQSGWPAGLEDVLNYPGRVYGYWINGRDHFYYAGDTEAFNEFLQQYAKLKVTPLTLEVHAGRGKVEKWLADLLGKQIPCDWKVRVITYGERDPGEDMLTLEVWLGGEVEPEKIRVPANVAVKAQGEVGKLIAANRVKLQQAERTGVRIELTAPPAARGKAKGATRVPVGLSDTAEAAAPTVPRPDKPLYAKVVLNEDGSKVLSVMFDGSKGTGTGYDVLYADVNFNGRFDDDERFEKASPPPVISTGLIPPGFSSHSFQPIVLNVPYNEKGQGITNPCEIVFRYQKYQIFPGGSFEYSGEPIDLTLESGEVVTAPGIVTVSPASDLREEFSVQCLIRLRDRSGMWEYSFGGEINPSETPASAPVWRFEGKPMLAVSARPDGKKEGHLGIGLDLNAGDKEFECRRGDDAVKAHVEVRKLDGTVVHQGDDDLAKFRFG